MSTLAGAYAFDANGSPVSGAVEIVEHYVNGSCTAAWLTAYDRLPESFREELDYEYRCERAAEAHDRAAAQRGAA